MPPVGIGPAGVRRPRLFASEPSEVQIVTMRTFGRSAIVGSWVTPLF